MTTTKQDTQPQFDSDKMKALKNAVGKLKYDVQLTEDLTACITPCLWSERDDMLEIFRKVVLELYKPAQQKAGQFLKRFMEDEDSEEGALSANMKDFLTFLNSPEVFEILTIAMEGSKDLTNQLTKVLRPRCDIDVNAMLIPMVAACFVGFMKANLTIHAGVEFRWQELGKSLDQVAAEVTKAAKQSTT